MIPNAFRSDIVGRERRKKKEKEDEILRILFTI